MIRYKPQGSALDSQAMLYNQFGKWHAIYTGIHHPVIPQLVWHKVKLRPKNNETYTVIASGTETMEAYFCTLMIFDSNDRDCLNPNNPQREFVIKWAHEKMKDTILKDDFWKAYKN